MSILGSVTQGGTSKPGQRMVIAGQEKMGKTTLAMGAPNALLVPLERDNVALTRYRHVPPDKIPHWPQVLTLCEELRTAAMRGQLARGSTIVWDSATALERYIHEFVIMTSPEAEKCRKAGVPIPAGLMMETAHEGYGKAYPKALDEFAKWSRIQDELASYGGINIVTTCHVFASRVTDPSAGEYDTWDLLLHSPKNSKTYGKREFLTQWADFIGFMHEPIIVMSAEKGRTLSRGMSQGQGRVLEVDRTPAWVAGNRYGLTGTIPIPLNGGWNTLAHAIHGATGGNIDVFNRS